MKEHVAQSILSRGKIFLWTWNEICFLCLSCEMKLATLYLRSTKKHNYSHAYCRSMGSRINRLKGLERLEPQKSLESDGRICNIEVGVVKQAMVDETMTLR